MIELHGQIDIAPLKNKLPTIKEATPLTEEDFFSKERWLSGGDELLGVLNWTCEREKWV